MNADHLARLLGRPERAGLYFAQGAEMDALAAAAQARGYGAYRVDLANAAGKEALLDRIARAMAFPEWFGRNWDALEDCLTDLSWLAAAPGWLVLLRGCPPIPRTGADELGTALRIFGSAARFWHDQGVPFWVVADAHHRELRQLPHAAGSP